MISEAILIPKIYARLQEIACNFSKFSGEAGGDPPGPLFKIPGSAPGKVKVMGTLDTAPLRENLIIEALNYGTHCDRRKDL